MSGSDAMARMVERVRALRTIEADTAEAARPAIEAAARATAAAGTTPTGEAWAPRKADGARALANATAGVSAVAVGAVVQVVLKPPYVFHQKTRQIIPGAGEEIPPAIATALQEAASASFKKAMGS